MATIKEMRELLRAGGGLGRGTNDKFIEKFLIALEDQEAPQAFEIVRDLAVFGEPFKAVFAGLLLTDRRLIAVTSWAPRKFTVYPKLTFFPFDLPSISRCIDRAPGYELHFTDGRQVTFQRGFGRQKGMAWFLQQLGNHIPPAVPQPRG